MEPLLQTDLLWKGSSTYLHDDMQVADGRFDKALSLSASTERAAAALRTWAAQIVDLMQGILHVRAPNVGITGVQYPGVVQDFECQPVDAETPA